MTTEEQVSAFEDEIDRVLDRFIGEFDLPVYAIAGVLMMKAQAIVMDVLLDTDNDDDRH